MVSDGLTVGTNAAATRKRASATPSAPPAPGLPNAVANASMPRGPNQFTSSSQACGPAKPVEHHDDGDHVFRTSSGPTDDGSGVETSARVVSLNVRNPSTGHSVDAYIRARERALVKPAHDVKRKEHRFMTLIPPAATTHAFTKCVTPYLRLAWCSNRSHALTKPRPASRRTDVIRINGTMCEP